MAAYALAAAAAAALAKGALNEAGAAVMEQQMHDLGIREKPTAVFKKAIRQSLEELSRIIHAAIAQQYLREVMVELDSLESLMDHFLESPASRIDTLDELAVSSNKVATQLRDLGWQAYASYPVAIGLQLLIQLQREIYLDESVATKKNISEKAFEQMISWNFNEWVTWSGRLFTEAGKRQHQDVLVEYYYITQVATLKRWLKLRDKTNNVTFNSKHAAVTA